MAASPKTGIAAHVGVISPVEGASVHSEGVGQQPLNDVGMRWSYHIHETLGSGAFGVVWCATEFTSGRRSAVKKLVDVSASIQSARRAFRELMSLTALRHDNLLSARGFVLAPNSDTFTDIFIISELMATDLHRIIISGQTLAASHVQLFIYQILRGLKYLHSTGIIHRDIKPANMLVNADCRLKIGDFGLACGESTHDGVTLAADVEAPGGTMSYVAPELLLGARVHGPSVDIWSAGCLLVELFTRKVLFHTSSTIQQLDLMVALLGGPQGLEDFKGVPDWATRYLRQRMTSSPRKSFLASVIPTTDARVLHLLSRMLVFSPRQRMSASQALSHAYCAPGRKLYHTTLCSCCHRENNLLTDGVDNSERLDARCHGNNESVSTNGVTRSSDCQAPATSDVDLDPVCAIPVNIDSQHMSIDELRDAIKELCTTDDLDSTGLIQNEMKPL